MRLTLCAFLALLMVAALAAHSPGSIVPGVTVNLDAQLDHDNVNPWEDTQGNRDGTAINGASAGPVVSGRKNLHWAYNFDGNNDGVNLNSFSTWGSNSGTFEIWFKTPDLADNDRLFETGGGTGVGITLGGGSQVSGQTNKAFFSVTQNSGGTQTSRVSADLTGLTSDFIQVVGVFDIGTDVATIYVNGQFVGSGPAASVNLTSWGGGDAASLGELGGSNQGGYGSTGQGFTNFEGQISIFRFYQNKTFNAAEVLQNYETVAFPEPSTILVWSLLAGLGIGIGWWRKRR